MSKLLNETYVIQDYQKQKPFSSFLSGIAGKLGKPLWSFYVNRGQGITSFGFKDKNGAILEFYPANLAYMYTSINGFRTFIKISGQVYEFFKEENENQTMFIDKHQLSIEETNEKLGIKVKVTYYTLPNQSIAGLTRLVEITNLSQVAKEILIVDGLNQLLPAGIDYGGYKAVSNLLQSWMITLDFKDHLFFKLNGSTQDSAEVSKVVDGNFSFTKSSDFIKHRYLYDYKLIFNNDSTFKTPYGLINQSNETLFNKEQVSINQVPSSYILAEASLDKTISFATVIGYTSDKDELSKIVKSIDFETIYKLKNENELLHEELLKDIETKSNYPLFDAYLKQCYLDNLMRGGIPIALETKKGIVAYHIYSRKHGDLERDYNFFSLEPGYYSQGNGNFRDVLQNRRNDLLFYPEIRDFNIYQFGSLIQADGYNPLSIEGVKFKYSGKVFENNVLNKKLEQEFSIGNIVEVLVKENLDLSLLDEIIKASEVQIIANFGEGYWQDHFTYLYDLLESYKTIYPELYTDLLFKENKYKFFLSPVEVRPRKDKYVLNKEGKIRQYDAIKHHHNQKNGWLKDIENNDIEVNLIGKLITLIINKYALLDPLNIGIMYEAGKPGWNDAMNGLPGLFASGVGESIELLKIVEMTLNALLSNQTKKVYLLKDTKELADLLIKDTSFTYRLDRLEKYRENLKINQEVTYVESKKLVILLEVIKHTLQNGLKEAKKINEIYPTYLTYEADKYTLQNKVGEYGLELVNVESFKLKPIASFLEAPARYIGKLASETEALELYKKIKKTELYDKKMKFYQTSVSLDNETDEIGRIKAFQKGWLERESNFLHMTYKYLLALLKAGLYKEFYEESLTNFTCFMDPEIYGRSPLENSSFIATSSNLDKSKHGQGFVARLSGSTSEMISMWKYMFLGDKLFSYEDNKLVFELKPKLNKTYFKDKKVETTLFRNIKLTYINEENIDTYEKGAYIYKMELQFNDHLVEVIGSKVMESMASQIRAGEVLKINAYIKGGKGL